ncbi:MAG: universal stress protein [Kiritimatiellia bacterium]
MIKNILIGVDGSPGSDAARDLAIDLAARLDARIEALHVVDSRMLEFPLVAPQAGVIGWNPGAVNGLQQALRQRGENLLRDTAAAAEQAGVPLATSLEFGHPAQVLADVQSRTELVVLGRQGEHSKTAPDLTGSTMERFIRRADRPCLVAPAVCKPVSKILVGVDGSPSAGRALREAVDLANALKIPLVILTVAEKDSDLPRAQQINLEAHCIARAHDCAAAAVAAVGVPAPTVMEKCAETGCDLVVLGSHGHGWIYDRLIGSVAAHVVSSGAAPVLLVR